MRTEENPVEGSLYPTAVSNVPNGRVHHADHEIETVVGVRDALDNQRRLIVHISVTEQIRTLYPPFPRRGSPARPLSTPRLQMPDSEPGSSRLKPMRFPVFPDVVRIEDPPVHRDVDAGRQILQRADRTTNVEARVGNPKARRLQGTG